MKHYIGIAAGVVLAMGSLSSQAQSRFNLPSVNVHSANTVLLASNYRYGYRYVYRYKIVDRNGQRYRVKERYKQRYRYSVRSNYKKRHYSRRNTNFPSYRNTGGRRTFVFSPRQLAWAAYDANGRLVRTGAASGGSHYCRDLGRACRTPRGTFHVISKRGAGCRSSKFPLGRGGSRMPYCMFFSKYYAVHGSYHVPGYNASHGCIRILPAAAHWLSSNFMTIGTRVVVTSY